MVKSKNALKALLGASSYWIINKKLAGKLGIEATLVFQHLLDLNSSFFNNGEFYQQLSRMENDLLLKKRQISNAIKKLQEEGFIEVTRKGLPRKNYYLINEKEVFSFMLQDEETCTTSDANFALLED